MNVSKCSRKIICIRCINVARTLSSRTVGQEIQSAHTKYKKLSCACHQHVPESDGNHFSSQSCEELSTLQTV